MSGELTSTLKHVLLEKPISIDVNDSKPVVDAANAKPDLKVMLGFVRRCGGYDFSVKGRAVL